MHNKDVVKRKAVAAGGITVNEHDDGISSPDRYFLQGPQKCCQQQSQYNHEEVLGKV